MDYLNAYFDCTSFKSEATSVASPHVKTSLIHGLHMIESHFTVVIEPYKVLGNQVNMS